MIHVLDADAFAAYGKILDCSFQADDAVRIHTR